MRNIANQKLLQTSKFHWLLIDFLDSWKPDVRECIYVILGASFTAVGNSAFMYGGMGSELYDCVLMLEPSETAKHFESINISR
jgi:hypothetical protein